MLEAQITIGHSMSLLTAVRLRSSKTQENIALACLTPGENWVYPQLPLYTDFYYYYYCLEMFLW